jgi:acetylornithine deacetylase/succinyl-diaminopimelate desuccinylase-like protein
MTDIQPVLDYLDRHRGEHLKQLFEFLRIPSISARSEHSADIQRAASFLADELEGLGLATEIIRPQKGHPLVFAASEIKPERPTLLFYGHYDVQPVDPEDLWESPPFSPRVVNGRIRARGASDDKGQLYCHIKAIEAFAHTGTAFPVNLKLIFEGEEESGGNAIFQFTEQHAGRLACDGIVIADTALFDETTPAICYGLRGICYMEILVYGPNRDLHSGSYGGAVRNPANALANIIASLRDEKGRVQVPGFYDQVRSLSRQESEAIESLGYSDAVLSEETGAPEPYGEAGYSSAERMWTRPSCDINGIWGGYAGEGGKTIIPAEAGAKLSMRLVPDQDPEFIAAAVKRHIYNSTPRGVKVAVRVLHKARPVRVPRDAPLMQAGMSALEEGFGHPAVWIREGGSIPIVEAFYRFLGTPPLIMGYGLPDDNIHSPNEQFAVDNFYRGIRTSALLMARMGKK